MFETLKHLFSFFCGQNPGHTWAPAGLLLPCCERCAGLYVGAAVASVLHLWLRPRPSNRFLQVHGAFLLLMVPFGFHWLPQGPVLRTVTGALFGFGVVTFLALPLKKDDATCVQNAGLGYAFGLSLTVILLPVAASSAGLWAAWTICVLAAAGLSGIVALVSMDGWVALSSALRSRHSWQTCLRR